MRVHNQTPIYIIALNFNDDNGRAAENEATVLRGIVDDKFKPVVGCWEGQEERSYVIPAATFNVHREKLVQLLKDNSQDAVLFCDNQRNAFLKFEHTDYDAGVYQGEFVEVAEQVAKQQRGWTRSGNRYYIVRAV